MATAKELYAREPESVTTEIYSLFGCYYCHVPELADYQYDNRWKDQERIKLKVLKFFDFDGRRFWLMQTVWFDDKPVMIVQNAGREGDDFHRRYITDKEQYANMIAYLFTLVNTPNPQLEDIVSEDAEIPTAFYDNELDGYFERFYY